ncbi:AAA family ATPase [Paenibacillus sp. PAMC 26794]|uniref:AAA family ATPase n=1 Tax=Paenibacillus sp. PAMC 26794 TaxID=1257080 RepID=UPI0002E11A07|nr:AAA family ATPase [Paenibacillus sp. PAMC 26794]
MTVRLPYIKKATLTGYGPMFNIEEVIINTNSQLTILLGGNGLGKTTILQSLVYGLASGLDNSNIEPLTNFRWSNNFFNKRVPDRSNAHIEVVFELGDTEITVVRNLNKSSVIKLKVIKGSDTKVYGANNANLNYEQIICEEGNFNSFEDFRFLVHRLLYLAENRRGITWDLDAQVRILMLLNSDVINEGDFRLRRGELKELDSKKRHLKVKINKLEKEYEVRMTSKTLDDENNEIMELDITTDDERLNILHHDEIMKITNDLKELITKRTEYEQTINSLSEKEANLRMIIYELSEQQRTFEAELISYTLQHSTLGSQLYLRKLVDLGLCPSCGTKSNEFKELAIERVKEGKCAICGMRHSNNISMNDITEVHSQLEEKIKAKLIVDNELNNIRYLFNRLQNDISQIETKLELDKYNSYEPKDSTKINLDPTDFSTQDLQLELQRAVREYEGLEILIRKESFNLDNEYDRYLDSAEKKIHRLEELFSKFAYEFLGSKVTLQQRKGGDKFLGITLFNPVFNNVVRESPEDCSEAQRFFLDIAMRLALLHLAYELTGSKNSFICETPESALDVSYIDNAATMFREFIQKGHSIIASTNLQRLGLAYKLVESKEKKHVSVNILDLIEIGNLSDVQQNSEDLKNIRDEIMEAANYDHKGAD